MENLTREQLVRRLQLVKEDLQGLISALNEHKIDIQKEDSTGSGICTYLSNIEMCVGVDDHGKPIDQLEAKDVNTWKLKSEL